MHDPQLLVFVKVAERGSFSRAAEELHMTQPAVSQHIQALERILGAKLLERNAKPVRPTKAGDIVYHHAKEILGLYARMQGLVDDLFDRAGGRLAIGASYTYGEYVLPHVIMALGQRFPEIQPTITIGNTHDIARLVGSRQLDIGVVEGPFQEPKVHGEPFAEDAMAVFLSPRHPLAGQKKIPPSRLQDETWIIREKGSGTREGAERLFQTLGIQPKRLLEFGSNQIIKESVEAGLGITLLSRWATRKELALGSLAVADIAGTPLRRHFSLVTQVDPFQTKAMEVFADLVRTLYADLNPTPADA